MLKLEKVSRKRDINITVRYKEKKFNRTFLSALGAAIGIHLTGALFFHIAPFKMGYQESTIPPVAVAIDISGMDSQWETMASIDDEKYIPNYLLLPITFEPPLPLISETSFTRDIGSTTPKSYEQSPFAALDRQKTPSTSPSLNSSEKNYPGIFISGPLASKILKPYYLPSSISNEAVHSFTFDIRVDDQTGEICWFQEKSDAFPSEPFNTAVECLKSLRFEENKNQFISVGEIKLSIPMQKGFK